MELPKSGFLSTVFSALLQPIIHRLDRGATPKYNGEVTIAGLKGPVRVRWDNFAVPHVAATKELDLFLAQGFLHAQERLWQMEISRRFLSGRMAEIFGNFPLPWQDLSAQFRGRTSVDFDYFVRLLGIRHAAVACTDLLSELEHQRLRAYSAGVNRYIGICGKKLPWEFRLLRHEPEPWTVEDTLTINKGFAFLLSTALYSRLNFLAVAARLKDQPDKLRSLIPTYPEDAPTIARALWNQTRSLWEFTSTAMESSGWYPAGHGSNSWVVAPSRSQTGGALLCNDPHLRMTLPSIWYLMHLHAESCAGIDDPYEVWGATIPGLPCVQLGHNRHIAWGITAALCDDVEIYREKIHTLEPDRYSHANHWRQFDSRLEPIAVRGKNTIQKIVRSTHRGPILSDFGAPSAAQEVLSVRWAGQEPSRELRAIFSLNCARNWNEFLASLADHSAPSLNFVYADVEGNIGYALAGKIPARAQHPSLLPLEGWKDENDWRGFIPFEELPRLFNPPGGVIATANNKIADASYSYYLSHFFEPPHRVARIQQLLAAREKHSPDDMAAMQMDVVSLHARALIEILRLDLTQLKDDDGIVRTAAERLLHWDGRCSESSVGATIFHVLHHRLLWNLLAPTLGEDLFSAYVEILNQCLVPTDAILQEPSSAWFRGHSRAHLVAISLKETCADLKQAFGENLEAWHWGELHQLLMNHSLGRIALLQPLLAIGPLPAAGNGTTINLGFYRHSNPYRQTVGPSLRFIGDLKNLENTGFILSSGQSGHPLSNHYADQTELWRRGKRISIPSDNSDTSQTRLILRPGAAYCFI
jgi:penicillin amidase